jgi:hypothetical protein
MADDWTDDIEEILSMVRQNCIDMYKYHLCRYFQYKKVLPIFRVPVLILNALNSVFSVGLQPYMEQRLISVLNCLISLIATLINSIEMYMGIQKSMESEMSSSQGFYILSIGIYKMLTLARENRDISGKQYLMECYNTYSELVRNSKLIKDPYMLQKDFLQTVDRAIVGGIQAGGASAINMIGNAETELEGMAIRSLQEQIQQPQPPYIQQPYLSISTHSAELPSNKLVQPFSKEMDIENKFPGLEENTLSFMPQFSIRDLPLPLSTFNQPQSDNYSSTQSPYPRTLFSTQQTQKLQPQQPQQIKRPSFTDPHDPLYELSRKGIFGGHKKSTFLEMAGVDLDNLDHSPPTSQHHRSQTMEGSFRSILSTKTLPSSPDVSHHSQYRQSTSSQKLHHYTNTQPQQQPQNILLHPPQQSDEPVLPHPTPLPRNLGTTQLEPDLSINISSVSQHIQQEMNEESLYSEPETKHQPLQSEPIQPPIQSPKEKGVRDIVQEIEKKPKKDGP